jgi:hypothetical protein
MKWIGAAAGAALLSLQDDTVMGSIKSAPGASPYAISETDLFGLLDYAAYPALAPVQKAVAANDMPTAKKALADYFRTRTTVPWDESPTVADRSKVRWKKEAAETARRGEVTVVAIKHTFPEAKIDWFLNPTGGTTGLPNNNEWVWQLNRMAWWGDFVRAYQATGDEAWAALWVQQMRSWVAQCPPPATVQNVPGSTWRTIECGIRMLGLWPTAYQVFLLSPSFGDDDLLAYVRTMAEHGRYLAAFPSTGNWLTMEMNGLYNTACLLPELKEAAAWRKQASGALYKEQTIQFLPDGAQYELTPGYHNVAVDNVLGLYNRAKIVGRLSELPGDYAARLERAFDFDLYLMTPDRSMPKFNDSWPYNVAYRMEGGKNLFPKRPDFAWIATDGKEGTPPTKTSYAFDYAGYFVMRDGWGRDACMGVLDAGPLGNGHFHQDKLNVVVWAYGREVLFDGGGGSYESSKYRAYATDTFGHNCVLVDGKPQRRSGKEVKMRVATEPIDARWRSTSQHDYAEGTYRDGWGKEEDRNIASHTRRFLFVKPTATSAPFWIVSDKLTPLDGGAHTYQARWNLLTVKTSIDPKTQTTVTTDEGQPNLMIVPLLADGLEVRSASAQTEPELLGWNVRKDLDPQYVPCTTVLHTRKGGGDQRFLTLLLPTKAGVTNPVRSIERPSTTEVVVTLTDGRRLRIKDDWGTAGLSAEVA